MREISRSKEKIEAVIGGQRVELALSLKYGNAQAFWYFVKLPCGGWREFDIREVLDIDDRFEWMEEAAEALGDGWRVALERVAEQLGDFDFEVFLARVGMEVIFCER